MFEKLMQAAERAADGVSRREFFGQFGRLAAIAGAAVAGASNAWADKPPGAYCDPATSSPSCAGAYVGNSCYVGGFSRSGTCDGAPSCICKEQEPRGGGRPGGRR